MVCGNSLILQQALTELTMAIQAHRLRIAAMNRIVVDEEWDDAIFLVLIHECQQVEAQLRCW